MIEFLRLERIQVLFQYLRVNILDESLEAQKGLRLAGCMPNKKELQFSAMLMKLEDLNGKQIPTWT